MPDYKQLKTGLLDLVDRLEDAVRNESRKPLADLKAKLRDEAFNLVVLGQFKRGKSTFVNALLGKEILPTAIVPLTSVVTILRHAPELRIQVRYLDDRLEDAEITELPNFITEKGNPENRKNVGEVTVYYPSEYLKGGVRIIDTPGVGSVYRHNTDTAYSMLPAVDAAVFIVSADPPLSESEHRFLGDVREYVDKFFFVLNKIDQVSEEDRRESLEFTGRVLEKDLGAGRVKIYPLSAKWALEAKISGDERKLSQSLLPEFEKKLSDFLMTEKGTVLLVSTANSLLKLVADESISCRLEQEAIKLPIQELTAKIDRFEKEIEVVTRDREHNRYLLSGHLKRIVSQIDEEIGSFKKESLPVLHEELEEEYRKTGARGGGNLRDELERFIFGRIQSLFNAWRRDLTEKIASELEQTHNWFALRTNETTERILSLTSSIFELDLKPFTSVEQLSRKSRFFFLFKDDPVGLELVRLAATSALPRFLAGKIIIRNMRTSVTELVDRHCGRVRYDLINRLSGAASEFKQSLDEKIDTTLNGIRLSFQKALALNQSGRIDADRSLGELSGRLTAIAEIRDDLLEFRKSAAGDSAP